MMPFHYAFASFHPVHICGNPFYDIRDGQYYETVQIGTQCWMAENLNVGTMIPGVNNQSDNGTLEKYCHNDECVNCATYGGLYPWDETMQYMTTEGTQGICPAGWHVPTDGEWKILEGNVDSQYPVGDPVWDGSGFRGFDAGINLKSIGGWSDNGNGTDIFEFTALPGGRRSEGGNFNWLGLNNYFYCSTESGSLQAWRRTLTYDYDQISRNANLAKINGFSIRCLKDD